MKLNYDIGAALTEKLGLAADEKIIYCIPFDISQSGNIIENSYVAVTDARLLVLTEGELTFSAPLSDCADARSESPADCGILAAKINGEDTVIVRFSMKHSVRFAYIAKGIRLLHGGSSRIVHSSERENFCEKCGRPLRGLSTCIYCDKSSRPVKKLWRIISPYKAWGALIILLASAAAFLSAFTTYVLRLFMDGILIPKSGEPRDAVKFFIILIALGAGTMLLNQFKNLSVTTLSSKISHGLRMKLFHKVQLLSLKYVDSRRPGQLLNNILYDPSRIKNFVDDFVSGLASAFFTVIFSTVFLFLIDWRLALLSMLPLPIIFLLYSTRRKKTRAIWMLSERRNDRLSSRLQDTISGIRVVKAYGREQDEEKRFGDLNEQHAQAVIRHELMWVKIMPIMNFFLSSGWYLVAFFGGLSVLGGGALSLGQLMQAITYCGMLSGQMSWFSGLPRSLNMASVAVERISGVLDEEPDITNAALPEKLSIRGDICFKNVSFGYNACDTVLENINFEVKEGEMIGIVGSSGTGKSTLINLIMRLYDTDEGSITVDGIDIRSIDMQTLHSQIGVVLQDTFLFSDTVINNIRYARPDASDEDIIRAAKMANAHNFICRLPDGYDTYIGERGYSLSGGERQRIAIARALLTDPKILILDEATSNLDTESEYQVQEALTRLIHGRTTFAIAHRLSTLRNADRLIVIDNHTVAEMGTHSELIAKEGIYYGLVTAQLEINDISSFEEMLRLGQRQA